MTPSLLPTPPSGGTVGILFPRPAAARCQSTFETDIVRFVERQLVGFAGQPRTVLVTVPAPLVAPELLLEAPQSQSGFFWDGGDGVVTAGLGAVHRIQLSGPGRVRKLRREAEQIWRRLALATHDACRATGALEQDWRATGALEQDCRATGALEQDCRATGALAPVPGC